MFVKLSVLILVSIGVSVCYPGGPGGPPAGGVQVNAAVGADAGMNGMNGPPGLGGPDGPFAPLKDFIKGLTPEARTEFMEIAKNKDTPKKEIQTKLQEWAAKQSPEIKSGFESATGDFKKRLEDFAKKESEKFSGDTEVMDAFNKIKVFFKIVKESFKAVAENMDLSHQQECEQIVTIVQALPEATRQKLKAASPHGGQGGPDDMASMANKTPAEICSTKLSGDFKKPVGAQPPKAA